MTKRVPTGVSPLGVVLALAIVICAPRASSAASISYEITIGDPVTIDGALPELNDIALFHFVLDEGTTYEFSALTNSLGIGGFDPNLALYLGSELYRFGEGDVAAVEDDTIDVEAMFSQLVLEAGEYTLALAHSGNEALSGFEFTWNESVDVLADFYGGLTCEDKLSPEDFNPSCGSTSFSLALEIKPAGGTPVPEPGTLSLLALGSLATAVVRRRRTRTNSTRK
jgi:hypothetical protein